MVTKVVMPRLSLTMKEGTVGKWYKKEGDIVEKGKPIVEVLSEKATYDLEAPASGILRKILVEEGVDAPVNAVLAVITAPDELFSETEILAEVPQTVEEAEKRVFASPAAKRLAREYGIDLSLVKGSGPEGRIVEEDVRRLVEETRGILPKVKEVIPLSGFRKTSAERVSLSFKTAPHSTIMMEVDVSKATELHEKLEVSYTAILVKAVAKALTEHPIINSTLEGNQIKIFEDVNVGVAVATEYGLVVPIIHNADRKSLKEIDATIKELTEKARQGKLTREDLSGGTFTITNLGMYGVEFFTPIINPPEAAILGVGKIVEKPVVISGKIETKPFMTLSLSYDHRIVDGAPAAEFLRKIKEKIEETLGLEG
ncbi:MAG: 2-oxo acid dehydrogenase subunit E2 [Candidatus Bathyarchaeota archaeon]|nr:2-oxo acid dehydrogenase subunit E2 [Candidatus Bathyarchaeota archaeon]